VAVRTSTLGVVEASSAIASARWEERRIVFSCSERRSKGMSFSSASSCSSSSLLLLSLSLSRLALDVDVT